MAETFLYARCLDIKNFIADNQKKKKINKLLAPNHFLGLQLLKKHLCFKEYQQYFGYADLTEFL